MTTFTASAGNDFIHVRGDGLKPPKGYQNRRAASHQDDLLHGMGGNDIIIAGLGNDTLDGGAGSDILRGNAGDDTYLVDNALDQVVEDDDEGQDLVKSFVDHTLADNVEDLVLLGSALTGTGNGLANTITGNDGNNRLDGADGDDSLAGGKGDDLYVIDSAGDTVTELADQGIDTIIAPFAVTLAAAVENLVLSGSFHLAGTGNQAANRITGNDGNNALSGLAGDDLLEGGSGNDILDGGAGKDTLKGGPGDDLFLVDDAGDTVGEQAGDGIDTVRATVSFVLSAFVDNLELMASAGTINGTGNAEANMLTGNESANLLDGAGGDDRIEAGAGDDTLQGGDGDDWLSGGTGDDVIHGGAGNDTLSYASVRPGPDGDGVTVDLAVPTAQATGAGGKDTISGTENLVGSDGHDILRGNEVRNHLAGGAGNDTLDGRGGADVLEGGGGNDIYVVDQLQDVIIEAEASGGNDRIETSVSYSLAGLPHVESLRMKPGSTAILALGNGLDNTLTGNQLGNVLDGGPGDDTLSGNNGDDMLVGGTGDDAINGGSGADTASYADTVPDAAGIGVTVDLSTTSQQDTGQAGLDTLTGIENLTGSTGADRLSGHSGVNVLDGGSGSDTLTGGAGNDIFVFSALSLSAAPDETTFDTITDIDRNNPAELIAYEVDITRQVQASVSEGVAGIDATGLAHFHAADDTLAKRLAATEAAIAKGGHVAGEAAIFAHGADSYLLISDGQAGLGPGDVLIRFPDLADLAFSITQGNVWLS